MAGVMAGVGLDIEVGVAAVDYGMRSVDRQRLVDGMREARRWICCATGRKTAGRSFAELIASRSSLEESSRMNEAIRCSGGRLARCHPALCSTLHARWCSSSAESAVSVVGRCVERWRQQW